MDCPLNDERLTLAGLFFEAHAGLSAELGRRLEAECGLSVSSFEVLLRVARSEGRRLRMSDLAAQVTLSSSGLTRAVDRLVAAGLVQRESCPSDRRGSYAALTPAGTKRIDDAARAHIGHLEEVFLSVLDTTQRAALEDALRALRDTLNPGALSGTTARPR
jgi:MarR family 2-MHQ and catechol resistance regulon transcriptional repressor